MIHIDERHTHRVTKLSTCNICGITVPPIITNSPPCAIMENVENTIMERKVGHGGKLQLYIGRRTQEKDKPFTEYDDQVNVKLDGLDAVLRSLLGC